MSSIKYSNTGSSIQDMSDVIDELPTDLSIPSHSEINMVNTLFKQNRGKMQIIFDELKSSILIGVLFILFSMPQVDDFVKKIVPSSEKSIYILLGNKAIAVIAVFYFLNNMYLVRKT